MSALFFAENFKHLFSTLLTQIYNFLITNLLEKIMKTLITFILFLSFNTYACIDYTGEYFSDAYGGVVEEIYQADCEFRQIIVKTLNTDEVILKFDWITDGSLQRNLSNFEFIMGSHKETYFSWTKFNQRTGAITKAKEFLSPNGDILRELTLIDSNGRERFERKKLRKLR